MAEFILSDASFTFNSVDLSDHVKTVTFNLTSDAPDVTAMGDDWRDFLAGLRSWQITLDFYQDFAAGKVDATFWAAFNGTNRTPIILRPDGAGVGATNPSFSGNVIITNYDPITGTVGDAAMAPVTLQGAGALARATS